MVYIYIYKYVFCYRRSGGAFSGFAKSCFDCSVTLPDTERKYIYIYIRDKIFDRLSHRIEVEQFNVVVVVVVVCRFCVNQRFCVFTREFGRILSSFGHDNAKIRVRYGRRVFLFAACAS